jgi:hypothetical protein
MRSLLRIPVAVLVFITLPAAIATAQSYKSQIEHPITRYKMTARLDPVSKTIRGHYDLTWWNHTDDTIPDLYFHLYLNGFKNLDSTWLRETTQGRGMEAIRDWLKTDPSPWGSVEMNKIRLADGTDLTPGLSFVHPDDDNIKDQTVARIVLPKPVGPRQSLELSVDFTSRLPRALARTGYTGDYFLAVQWFPKIGVYEGLGDRGRTTGAWNCHQFHHNAEFYADYGSYDVDITTPSNFIVGATGYERREQPNPDGSTTRNYYQEDVHDFAWTASPHFLKRTRAFEWGKEVRGDEVVQWSRILQLPPEQIGLRDVKVTLLLQPDHSAQEDRYFRAAFAAVKYFGLWYGQYPYDTLTVLDPPRNSNTAGMEYPTLIVAGSYMWLGDRDINPEFVTIHEFGHQFWYGLVGNNETEEAWLDEGLNTYSTAKVIQAAYGAPCNYQYPRGVPIRAHSWLDVTVPNFPFAGVGSIPVGLYFSCVEMPQRSEGRARAIRNMTNDGLDRFDWQFLNRGSYGANSYSRTGLALRTLEAYMGNDVMARVMRTFQQRWRFRHPARKDFIDTVNEVSGNDWTQFITQLFDKPDLVDYSVDEITNQPALSQVGIYDDGGKPVLHPAPDAEQAFEKSASKKYASTVLVRRLGGIELPVDVIVQFENGETAREHWDGKQRWARFTYVKAAKVKSAEVDPDKKLVIDSNYTNNSRTAQEDPRAAWAWYVRWIFWLENLFFAAGFFA